MLIDGKALAQRVREETRGEAQRSRAKARACGRARRGTIPLRAYTSPARNATVSSAAL